MTDENGLDGDGSSSFSQPPSPPREWQPPPGTVPQIDPHAYDWRFDKKVAVHFGPYMRSNRNQQDRSASTPNVKANSKYAHVHDPNYIPPHKRALLAAKAPKAEDTPQPRTETMSPNRPQEESTTSIKNNKAQPVDVVRTTPTAPHPRAFTQPVTSPGPKLNCSPMSSTQRADNTETPAGHTIHDIQAQFVDVARKTPTAPLPRSFTQHVTSSDSKLVRSPINLRQRAAAVEVGVHAVNAARHGSREPTPTTKPTLGYLIDVSDDDQMTHSHSSHEGSSTADLSALKAETAVPKPDHGGVRRPCYSNILHGLIENKMSASLEANRDGDRVLQHGRSVNNLPSVSLLTFD